jgi:hypothetical protein
MIVLKNDGYAVQIMCLCDCDKQENCLVRIIQSETQIDGKSKEGDFYPQLYIYPNSFNDFKVDCRDRQLKGHKNQYEVVESETPGIDFTLRIKKEK